MKQVFINLFYWFLDYIYVAKVEVTSLFNRGNPEQYRNTGGRTVILLPGVYENWRFMKPVATRLHMDGYDVHVVDGLGYNLGSVEDMGDVVNEYILKNNLRRVVLVSHSKGGLIGKYTLSTFPKKNTISGLVALNSPFSGSRYAYLLPIKSLRIFIPNSPILTTLSNNQLVNERIVSIYGKYDPHIPGGSNLKGATNVQLNTYGHFRIIKEKSVHQAILSAIDSLL